MRFAEKPLFYNSILLFSEESMEILANSTIAVAGIGGFGCIITEMLARNGIGNLRVADIDPYEDKNLNRQMFATLETVGVNKAVAARDRIKIINPDCNVTVFENGIFPDNVDEFCEGADIVFVQTDTETSKVILHRAAKKFGIPVINGSRGSLLEHRWFIKAKIWNYKEDKNLACYDETNHPELATIPNDKMTLDLLKSYDEKIKQKKIHLFNEFATSNPKIFGSISQEDLLERISNNKNYYNRHVCSVLANTGGSMAAAAAIRLLLGGPEGDLEINLWEGSERPDNLNSIEFETAND